MRETKFRVWDIAGKCWVPKNLFLIDADGAVMIKCSGVIFKRFTEGFVVCRYTGLKDKNGKEIYEGNIISWSTTEGANIVHAVEWFNKDACFGCGGLPFEVIFQSGFYQPGHGKSNLEVIGNIYDNPEILKEEKK